jgi:hypothetical protein
MRGKTREALAKALVIGNSTLQMIKALLDLNELDPVLRGEVALRDQAKRFNVSHGGTYTTYNNFSFGRGDKFDASFDPLRRYLRPWKKKKFEFPHVNPKEAARRIKIIEAVMEDLAAVKADLEPRSVAPKVIASAERRRVNGA